jgi:choloylglycine hydrolase
MCLTAATIAGNGYHSVACTGISLTAKDGSYVQARTIEWAYGALKSEYVIIPRGEKLQSFTPTGTNGLTFTSKYGVVGLAVVEKEFIAEGINEAGLSAGLFFFPRYGKYEVYDEMHNNITLADMQVVQWALSQFATIDELKEGVKHVRIVGLDKTAVVHWRIGEASGRQVVMEIVNGEVSFYENIVGVLTNAPGFEWQLANLDNYVNLRPGSAENYKLGDVQLQSIGRISPMLGLPGDFTPPSRFVRAAFFRNTAPQRADGYATVLQCFHILNNFDVPIAIENPAEKELPSATQWTSAIDLTARKVYYKTVYNNSIRCIDLNDIDFSKVKYQSHPLDDVATQPVQMVKVS